MTPKRLSGLTAVALICLFAAAAPARADDHAPAGGAGHAANDPVTDSGLKRWDLAIYTLVVFGLLLFILSRFAWGPIQEGLAKREQTIRGALDAANKAKAEADSAHQQFLAKMAAADDQVRRMIDEARADAQRLATDLQAKAKADIQQERDRLRREIDTARDQALQDIWQQSVQLATLLSSKTIQRNLSPDDHRRLVDEALGELKAAGAKA